MFSFVAACLLLARALAAEDVDCVFRAAVYESAFRLPDPDPIQTMQVNLDEFRGQAQMAADQGAQIIVFPEMGVTGLAWNSSQDEYYQQVPSLGSNPCLEGNGSDETTMVVQQLSCMARSSSLYVVANLASTSPCGDGTCPARGNYRFNTNAAFDSNGTLVAVYHKMNLYGEPEFDDPPTAEHVFFDSPFGRVGLITCFDLLWPEPTVTLAEEDLVDTIAFPTAWMDQLPYLASIQAQAAWAAGLDVNILAANMHFPREGFMGSGLYAGLGGPVKYVYEANFHGTLVVDDLPCHPSSAARAVTPARKPDSGSLSDNHYIKYEDMSAFVGIPMPAFVSEVRLCQDALCCGVEYEVVVEDAEAAGHYALVVHRGNVSEGDLYTYAAEICSVLWCSDEGLESCARQPSNVTAAFDTLELWGNFSTPYVYPSVLTDTLRLAHADRWHYNGTSDGCEGLDANGTCAGIQILAKDERVRATAISLYGRLYASDPV